MQKLINKKVIFWIFFISIFNTYGNKTVINDSIKPICTVDSIEIFETDLVLFLNNNEKVHLILKQKDRFFQSKSLLSDKKVIK